MKFNIDKDALLKEIEIAQEYASSRAFIEASSGKLAIRAGSGVSIGFEASIPADVAEEGETTVYCDELEKVLSSLPAGEISFLSDGESQAQQASKISSATHWATIKPLAKSAFFLIQTRANNDFPYIAPSQDVEFFNIPVRSLKRMISHTVFAVSTDELRRFMTGVFAEKEDGFLKFVATDGRRLAAISTKIEGAFPDFDAALIPVGILKAIAATCPDEGIVSMGFDKSRVFFRFEEIEASAFLILGEQSPTIGA